MSTRTTFEDRLLAELQREVERRSSSAEELAPQASPARSRSMTGRRLVLAAAACAVAGLALALILGSPADSPAYAVERNKDGTVTLSIRDMTLDREAQRELAERLDAYGVEVDIQNLPADQYCARHRGELRLGVQAFMYQIGKRGEGSSATDSSSSDSRLSDGSGRWVFTLHRGDTLAFENWDISEHSNITASGIVYAVKGKILPCVPVPAPLP
ncbi:hypothetical protein ACWCPF_15885 [Streptomyces sp. NPDC001858]